LQVCLVHSVSVTCVNRLLLNLFHQVSHHSHVHQCVTVLSKHLTVLLVSLLNPECKKKHFVALYRVGRKTRLFFLVDNFATVNGRMVCSMLKVSKFCPEKNKLQSLHVGEF